MHFILNLNLLATQLQWTWKSEKVKPNKIKVFCIFINRSTYNKPDVLFSSFTPFSGTLPPVNHFLVAENKDRLKPFLDIN